LMILWRLGLGLQALFLFQIRLKKVMAALRAAITFFNL
jgi:hypothetical protein